MVASGVILAIYGIHFFWTNGIIKGEFQMKFIKTELIYAIPMIMMQLAIFSINSSDKFILAHFASDNSIIGIYGIASLLSSVMVIFCSAFISYLYPLTFKALSQQATDYSIIKTQFINYIRIMAATMIVVLIGIPFAYHFVINSKYQSGIDYYYFLVAGFFLWSISTYIFTFLVYYREKRKLVILSLLIIALSIGCSYFLTGLYGVTGAALGVFMSNVLALLLTSIFARKYLGIIFSEKVLCPVGST